MEFIDRKTSASVLIIGGGPAGLSISYELARRGIDSLILEAGPVAGASFAAFPRNIFFGPWVNNLLPGSSVHWRWLLNRSTQPSYARYLQEYCRANHLPIRTGVKVLEVGKHGEQFRVETSAGVYEAPLVINATGYFSHPYIPQYPGAGESSIPQIHVAQYRDANTVRNLLGRSSGRVLVVGKRLSAGETMCELYHAGFQVTLAHRGKLRFGPSQFQEALISPIVWVYERLGAYLNLKFNSYPRMAGGESRRLIRTGQVPTRPNIERFYEDRVRFQNGFEERFDLVIYATGYRAALDHLKGLLGNEEPELQGMESARVSGLFFLGLDGLRSFRSRFLRGIRRDSLALAEIVARRALRYQYEPVADVEEETRREAR